MPGDGSGDHNLNVEAHECDRGRDAEREGDGESRWCDAAARHERETERADGGKARERETEQMVAVAVRAICERATVAAETSKVGCGSRCGAREC